MRLTPRRAWLVAAVWLSSLWATPLLAATRVTIHELKEHAALYEDQELLLECFYDKESPIWVSALPDADEWIGFFVTGPPEKSLTWRGEYYNLLFAPRAMQETMRLLRGGDKITLVGQGFHYHSQSMEGVGVRVQQVLRGWGPAATALPTGSSPTSLVADIRNDVQHAMRVTAAAEAPANSKYTAVINGKRYEGLRFGDHYNFDGTTFQIDQAP